MALEFDFCEVRMIPMGDLELDPRLNRDVIRRTIAEIEADPDPDMFGVIQAALLNGHGKYTIYDGGHRFTWLLESGYEGEVPVAVAHMTDPHELAKTFVLMNRQRRPVNPWDRYVKLLFAEVPDFVMFDRVVRGVGWQVGPKATERVVSPTTPERLYRAGQEIGLVRTIELARDLWDGDRKATDATILMGLWRVLDSLGEGLDRERLVKRLGPVNPAELLVRARERRARERGTMARNVEREIVRAYRSRGD